MREKERRDNATISFSTLVLQSSTMIFMIESLLCCHFHILVGIFHYRTWLAYSNDGQTECRADVCMLPSSHRGWNTVHNKSQWSCVTQGQFQGCLGGIQIDWSNWGCWLQKLAQSTRNIYSPFHICHKSLKPVCWMSLFQFINFLPQWSRISSVEQHGLIDSKTTHDILSTNNNLLAF